MEINLKNIEGNEVGTIEVRDDVFAVPMNAYLVHQVIVGYQANARQGTHKTKNRVEVSGGGKKPRPQKHTGGARQGSIRAPQWRHGGVVFGPTPRSYRQYTPKRVRRAALTMTLSDKVKEGNLVVVEALAIEQPKTKEVAKVLGALGVASSRTLFVGDGASEQVIRSAHNIAGVKLLPAAQLNSLDLMKHEKLVMTVDAVRKVESLWGGPLVRGKKKSAAADAQA
ncbi:MAG: 50S ribosomal protein L4 [SAR202 cluster bacterium]|nr:50S ribosomal protein L4 [SAR202 cluster bacterium]